MIARMSPEQTLQNLRDAIHQTLIGKDDVIDLLLTALISQGHVLIEDVPGVGKTSMAQALAQSMNASFQRIQFTSDLLPSDILGVPIFNTQTRAFEFHKGPIFSNLVLADEINRTTPKTQSALLEAMQEGQVTIDRHTHPLPKPFMVIATQNPIEQFGTYPLPESQLDRFLLKLNLGYPSEQEEKQIMQKKGGPQASAPLCTLEDVERLQRLSQQQLVSEDLSSYILSIVQKTRFHEAIKLGVSPRGSIALYRAAQSLSLLKQRSFVTPDDIQTLCIPALTHRLVLKHSHQGNPAEILQNILDSTPVPV